MRLPVKAKVLLPLVITACVCHTREAYAGIPVFDAINDASNVIQNFQLTKIKKALSGKGETTINHYTSNIDNWTKNIDNSMNINTDITADLTWIISIGSGDEDVPIPKGVIGTIEAVLGGKSSDDYVAGFQSATYYVDRKEEGFDEGGLEGSRARKAANDALMKSIDISRIGLQKEAESRHEWFQKSLEVTGQARQLQVANSLAHSEVDQLMKLRSMMLVSEAARAAENQASADKDARAIATNRALRDGLTEARNQIIKPQPKY